jgi:hypothetical protein
MLCNPYTTQLPVNPETRMLEQNFVMSLGIVGLTVADPKEPWRHWTIQWLFAPIVGRKIGGLRARLMDARGFVTFCNQRDLETLLGVGPPGTRCRWMRDEYLEPRDPDWYGLCADEEDLRDDLFERELRLRYSTPDPCVPLTQHVQLERYVHYDEGNDFSELFLLLHDSDTSFKNVGKRWTRVDKQRVNL